MTRGLRNQCFHSGSASLAYPCLRSPAGASFSACFVGAFFAQRECYAAT